MNKALSIFNELRPSILGRSVGFDQIFDSFAKTFDDDFFNTSSNYPVYDILKTGENKYDVEVALAGFSRKDISVSVNDGMLSIESVKNQTAKEKDENGNVIHKGIAKRYFKKSFSIADNCEVKGAELKDGLLKVSLERIIPDTQKAKVIEVK